MSIRTPREAIAWARDQAQTGAAIYGGYCLKFVRESLNIDARYSCATEAWQQANKKHPVANGSHCPRGVPVFWTGGPKGYGHVVLSVGDGKCYSTDIYRAGHVDLTTIDGITRAWGNLDFVGWAEDLNGVTVYQAHTLSPWAEGVVYLGKLHKGTKDSDSVRRLQYRLIHHKEFNASKVRLTGNYGLSTKEAIQRWQRNVSTVDGPRDGASLSHAQASKLFGRNYQISDS